MQQNNIKNCVRCRKMCVLFSWKKKNSPVQDLGAHAHKVKPENEQCDRFVEKLSDFLCQD